MAICLHSLCSQRSQCCRGWVLSPPWSWADLWGWWRRTTPDSTCLDGSLWWTNITCGENRQSYNDKSHFSLKKNVLLLIHNILHSLPCITLKSPIWCNHIDTWWFKRKFPRKYKFSMIISSWKKNRNSWDYGVTLWVKDNVKKKIWLSYESLPQFDLVYKLQRSAGNNFSKLQRLLRIYTGQLPAGFTFIWGFFRTSDHIVPRGDRKFQSGDKFDLGLPADS